MNKEWMNIKRNIKQLNKNNNCKIIIINKNNYI